MLDLFGWERWKRNTLLTMRMYAARELGCDLAHCLRVSEKPCVRWTRLGGYVSRCSSICFPVFFFSVCEDDLQVDESVNDGRKL